jgi:hypothetical protein
MIFTNADATGFEEDARLTAMWLWTLSPGESDGEGADVADDEELDEDEEDGGANTKSKARGFVLEYDAARKIAQGLGAHLEQLARYRARSTWRSMLWPSRSPAIGGGGFPSAFSSWRTAPSTIWSPTRYGRFCACARSCGWYCATAAMRAKGRSWCVTSRTRSSRRWRSQYVLVSAVNAHHHWLAQRNCYFPLWILQRLDARRQYSALPSALIGDRAWRSNPGTKSSLQEKISATGGRLTLPSLLFISTTFGTDGRLMTIRNRSGSLIARS